MPSTEWPSKTVINPTAFVELGEVEHPNTESFEDFHIRLRCLAHEADLCTTCVDARMAPRIMAGFHDTETKRKFLALTPFPSAQQAFTVCRSEEAARMNERSLSDQPSVNHGGHHQHNDATATICGSCSRNNHRSVDCCPSTGKTCHNCGGTNHFSPRCTKPLRRSGTGNSGSTISGDSKNLAQTCGGGATVNLGKHQL